MKTYRFIPKSLMKFKGKWYETADLVETNRVFIFWNKERIHNLWRLKDNIYWQYRLSSIYFPDKIAENAEKEYKCHLKD